jgi:hypothetical protein
MATIVELKCPYCKHPLNNQEYESAVSLFEETVKTKYESKLNKQQHEFQERLTKLEKQKEEEKQDLVNQMTSELEEEIYKKDMENKDLYKKMEIIESEALVKARSSIQTELDDKEDKIVEKEIQIKRVQYELDRLKKQLSEAQSELRGEVGELNLFDKLKSAFGSDIVERCSRGVESGDIIHQIKLPSGAILDTKIIYDNKNANSVTQKDIEKAKRYMQIHNTEYVIIVSKNLPKRDIKNGLYGEIDGVLLVHPSIIIDVSHQLRKVIIKLSRISMSCKEEQNKQSRLYNFIKSPEFNTLLESISKIYETKVQIQYEEEKQHNTLWKKRKKLDEQLRSIYLDISAGIDSITGFTI